MAITILNRPYDNKVYRINPVYNGLGFIVDSTYKSTPNFKYIAEIYDAGNVSKYGELRHNPDISNQNRGMFDVGRVLEDFITYTLNYKETGISNNYNAALGYTVRFGEEYTRSLKPTAINNNALETNSIKITTSNLITIKAGSTYPEAVYIEGSANSTLNGFKDCYSLGTGELIIKNTTYAAGTYGDFRNITIVQGERFNGVSSYVGADGASYVKLKVTNYLSQKSRTNFNVGDKIFGKTTDGSLAQMENIEWSITDIATSNSGSGPNATAINQISTNIPWTSVASTTSGWIVSRNNFQFKNLVNTFTNKSIATNGVEQYDSFLNYDAKFFVADPNPLTTTTLITTAKFLTKRVKRSISLCTDEYFMLSAFNPLTTRTHSQFSNPVTNYMIELWRINNPYSSPQSVTSLSFNNYLGSSKVFLNLTGNKSDITIGSITRVFGWYKLGSLWQSFNSSNIRVFSVYYNSATNITQVGVLINRDNLGFTATLDGTHPWTLTVTQKISLVTYTDNLQTKAFRIELPAGPKNLKTLVSYIDTDVSKYYIFPVWTNTPMSDGAKSFYNVQTGNAPLSFIPYKVAGEKFEVLLDCNCSKYKRYSLMWLNELGGWDWFDFDARTDKTRSIDRAQYGRKLFDNTYSGYSYNYGDKGKSTFNVNSRDTWTMRSKFLTQDELDWISYIYESPEVYIIDQSKNEYETTASVKAIPVNITNTDVELFNKTNLGDRGSLYQYTIVAEAANARVVQRGSNFGGYFYNRS
jgi:hypothetical protein